MAGRFLNDTTASRHITPTSEVSFKVRNNIVFRVKSHAVSLQVITEDPGEVIGLQELSRPLKIRRNIKSKMMSGLCIWIRPKNTGLTVETPEQSGDRWRNRSLPQGEVKKLVVKKKEPLSLSECSVMCVTSHRLHRPGSYLIPEGFTSFLGRTCPVAQKEWKSLLRSHLVNLWGPNFCQN